MEFLYRFFVHPEDFDSELEDERKTIAGVRSISEIRIFTKSGETRWLRISRLPVYSGERIIGYEGIATDITQSKLLQERLIRSERLAATGQLAASVAHEINSPLQAITVMLNTISEKHAGDKELLESIEILKKAFTSIRDTVKNLMDLNRPGMEPKHSLNINEIIKKTSALVKTHLKQSRVGITLDLSPEIPNIIASPQGLGHVFLNLINNAVEVMSGVFKNSEKWMTRDSETGKIFVKSRFQKDHIVIKFADTGPGIPKDELNRIFDPFYTKKKTMGMGVGLSICNGIIEDHGGSIEAKNIPGGGALFTLTLPVKEKSAR
jgi:signal transduction histidine kinase